MSRRNARTIDRFRTRALLLLPGVALFLGGCSYGGSQGYTYSAAHGYSRAEGGPAEALIVLTFLGIATIIAWMIDD
ncbi:MAG: hypothetical protein RIB58_01180 [Phycisphaerales bacterium]|jgi:hypothetical protein